MKIDLVAYQKHCCAHHIAVRETNPRKLHTAATCACGNAAGGPTGTPACELLARLIDESPRALKEWVLHTRAYLDAALLTTELPTWPPATDHPVVVTALRAWFEGQGHQPFHQVVGWTWEQYKAFASQGNYLDHYAKRALSFMNKKTRTVRQRLSLAGLGLGGESGGVVDLIKKVLHHDRPLDDAMREKMVLEAGDVVWYLNLLAHVLGLRIEDFARRNEDKLNARYPNGFTMEASIRKTDEKR